MAMSDYDAALSPSTHDEESASIARFANDVHYYLKLQPRQLPSRYLYDALGSALFDAICLLPWYQITRAEMRLLAVHGRSILAHIPRLTTIVELGPGSGQKLATLVGADRHLSTGRAGLEVHLVDVSPSALALSSRTLNAVGDLHIVTHEAPYEVGLGEVTRVARAGRTLVVLLGSNIGNFDRPGAHAFLGGIRAALASGDSLLLGADLVKAERDLLLAYDDPLGVTAAFNRNLLVRINRELGGNFDVDAYSHKAIWNGQESRAEMHLVSLRPQRVRVEAAELDFEMEKGESIWTESSYKYLPGDLVTMLEHSGFRLVEQWIESNAGFALTLAKAV
jgi:L-histidine Nalpha-methyltransferase